MTALRYVLAASLLGISCAAVAAVDYNKASREAYGLKGIPHMLIIGRDGHALKMHRGYSEKSLDVIIAEINAALARA